MKSVSWILLVQDQEGKLVFSRGQVKGAIAVSSSHKYASPAEPSSKLGEFMTPFNR
jgi:hypothetical protein